MSNTRCGWKKMASSVGWAGSSQSFAIGLPRRVGRGYGDREARQDKIDLWRSFRGRRAGCGPQKGGRCLVDVDESSSFRGSTRDTAFVDWAALGAVIPLPPAPAP